MAVAGAHRRPIRHPLWQICPERRVRIRDQTCGAQRGLPERHFAGHRIQQVHDEDGLVAERIAEREILFDAEAVGDGIATDTVGNRAFARPVGCVVEHVPPVEIVHVQPAGEADHGNSHLLHHRHRSRLKPVRAGDQGRFRPRLAKAGPFQELAEKPLADRVQHLVQNADL